MDFDNHPQETNSLADDLFGQPLVDEHGIPSATEPDGAAPAPLAVQQPIVEDHHDQDDDDDDDDAGGLFGSDDDEDMADAVVAPLARSPSPVDEEENNDDDGLTSQERLARQRLEYEEGDSPALEVVKEERIAQIELANFGVPEGGKVWHARLPNFLSLESGPFDELLWEPMDPIEGLDGDEGGDGGGDGGKKRAPVPDENVIRWRWTKDQLGQVIKQSNARIIRWSDSSLSLQIGSELFDMSLALDHSALLSTPSLPVVPSTTLTSLSSSTFDTNRGHGLTYLTTKHDYTGLLEAQASVHGTLTFRPTTLQSNTHRRLAGNIAKRNLKSTRTKLSVMPSVDPEKRKMEREKMELDKAKKAKREAAKARGGGGGAAGRRKRFTRIEGVDIGGSDEDDDDDGEGGVYATGSRSQPRRGTGGLYQGQEEEDYGDDDGFVAKDSEDEDEGGEGGGGYGGEEDEEMEEAEASLERERKERKEAKRAAQLAGKESSTMTTKEEPTPAPRRRLIVDDSDDEE